MKKFYITTAIAYTSRKPHVGNAYDPVLADAIARYKRMMGFDVFFLTGTDEHGLKVEQNAAALGMEPKAYVDSVAAEVRGVWDCMNTSYDHFIRTTDEHHEKTIQRIFKKLYDQDDIYKGAYEGKYCVPCESFFTASQLKDEKCPDCGREVSDAQEEAYFLRLGKYQDRLVKFYDDNPDFFLPASRRAEMINNFIKPGLSDLCVSRTTFKWGIPVDFDPGHVVYVWLDALSNYITGIGYDPNGSTEQFSRYWPADLHVIGKDIVRFHTIYWPIILMALNLPLPKQVLGHPWVLVGEDKMSKSTGNVLYADELADHFGVDAVRYYLLSEIPFAQDGSITYESLIAKYNTELANTLGNLVNRSVAMTKKYFDGTVSRHSGELDGDMHETVKQYISAMDIYRTADAADAVMKLAARCNKYIDETAPWLLAKDENSKERLEQVLYNLLSCIRSLGIMLKPFVPATADAMLRQLGLSPDALTIADADIFDAETAFTVGDPVPLFARIDAEAKLTELAAAAAENAPAMVAEESAAPENVTFLEQILYDDFMKVDLRVAEVTGCEPIKKAKKLLKLTLNDGTARPRTVCSGIAQWYSPQDLIGKRVIVVANLKPAVLCGVESNGMILAADDGDAARVIFVEGVAPGNRVR